MNGLHRGISVFSRQIGNGDRRESEADRKNCALHGYRQLNTSALIDRRKLSKRKYSTSRRRQFVHHGLIIILQPM